MILASGVRGRGFNSRSAPSFSLHSVEAIQIIEMTVTLSFLLIIWFSWAHSICCCRIWIGLSVGTVAAPRSSKLIAIYLCLPSIIEGIDDITSESLAVIDAWEIILESHCSSHVLPYALCRSIAHAINCLVVTWLHSATWVHINRWIMLAAPH